MTKFLMFDFVIINLKNTIWPNHVASGGQQNRKLRLAGGGEALALGDFCKFVTKIMHFRHISAKLHPQNLKQQFDWGGGGPSGYALGNGLIVNRLF